MASFMPAGGAKPERAQMFRTTDDRPKGAPP